MSTRVGDPAAAGMTGDGAHPEAGPLVRGAAIVYRLYDTGYQIHLDRALDRLSASAPERVRPIRGEAQALQVPNPPVTVILGTERLVVDGAQYDAELSARIFDFGVVSLRLRFNTPGEIPWEEFVRFGRALDRAPVLADVFDQHLRLLTDRLRDVTERPAIAPVTEDYIVFRVGSLRDEVGRPLGADALGKLDVAPLLLGETRPLSPEARRELLPHRFSYYADDLAILTWDNALVVEPAADDADVQYILEFANAQLLELRYFDAVLDTELPKMYDRIERERGGTFGVLNRRYGPLLRDLQHVVADVTELVERVDNALKVTDDVYLARIYASALEIFRGRAWRAGIDRKLGIIRDTYGMLNDESQSGRAELLELSIVLLIVFEIVMAFVRGT